MKFSETYLQLSNGKEYVTKIDLFLVTYVSIVLKQIFLFAIIVDEKILPYRLKKLYPVIWKSFGLYSEYKK